MQLDLIGPAFPAAFALPKPEPTPTRAEDAPPTPISLGEVSDAWLRDHKRRAGRALEA